MKACRVVSTVFLGMVETYESFKDAQVLLFTEYNKRSPLNDFNFALVDTNRNSWRGVRIDVFELRGQLWKIPHALLENVTFVSLVARHPLTSTPMTGPSDIGYVLNSTRQISHLQLSLLLFDGPTILADVLSHSAVAENLKNLKRLDILGHTDCYDPACDYKTDNPLSNFDKLASILRNLESFVFRDIFSSCFHYSFCKANREFHASVVSLLQANRETLREVSLPLVLFQRNDDICAVRLPRLKTLTATVFDVYQGPLKDFIDNHDSLEELVVHVKEEFEENLLDVVKQRCPNLKKLHLQAKEFVDSIGRRRQEQISVDWTFLRGMTRLQDFQLSRPGCNNANWQAYGNGSRLLECLPRNQLERLGFRGIGARAGGFWRNDAMESQPELLFKLDLLRGFVNLKRLSLRYCPDAVDDDVIRFIVTEMTSLEALEVSHCSKLSDAGIRGTSEDGSSSDSIRNLKSECKSKIY